jgi:hypothetical protein
LKNHISQRSRESRRNSTTSSSRQSLPSKMSVSERRSSDRRSRVSGAGVVGVSNVSSSIGSLLSSGKSIAASLSRNGPPRMLSSDACLTRCVGCVFEALVERETGKMRSALERVGGDGVSSSSIVDPRRVVSSSLERSLSDSLVPLILLKHILHPNPRLLPFTDRIDRLF